MERGKRRATMKTLLAFLLLASAALAWYQVPRTSASLSGTANSSTVAANLTTEGTVDWVHWGDTISRKSGSGTQISTFRVVGRGTVVPYNDDPRPLSWADGVPMPSSNSNLYGVLISGVGNGFVLSAPADATRRTLVLHVGGWKSGGTLRAHLSDKSVADYVDTTAAETGQYNRNYTLTYQAARPRQTLEVTWTMASGDGHVTLSGVALSAAQNDAAGPPAVVKLEWDPPARGFGSSDVLSYRIYRSTDSKNFPGPPIAEIPLLSGASYSDTNVRRGQTFYYQVRTVSRSGVESAPTNIVQTAAPVDACAAAPLLISGLKWPESRSSSRSFSWDSSTRTVVSVSYSWPIGLLQSALFTDDRGCTFLAKN
jgi:hypothetical protein